MAFFKRDARLRFVLDFYTSSIMQKFSTPITAILIAFATLPHALAAETGQAAADSASHTGQAVVWPYSMLLKGKQLFDRRTAAMPGATLHFRMPDDVVPSSDAASVRLVSGKGDLAMPLAADGTFTLPADAAGVPADAKVVVNRRFKPGVYKHPNVEVRATGLGPNVRLLGGSRVACEVQLEVAKGEQVKMKMMLGMLGMFTDVCGEKARNEPVVLNTPVPFDGVTLVAGERKQLFKLAAPADSYALPVSASAWPEDTQIFFTLDGKPVQL